MKVDAFLSFFPSEARRACGASKKKILGLDFPFPRAARTSMSRARQRDAN